ncbi:hypothetical protein [Streptomyces sp. NPDC006477]|uniref:hypothetical protein n=1 Tax=Streptomyces sp. NPDC006477 TaxID=3364747 RepID=UPI0036BF2D72
MEAAQLNGDGIMIPTLGRQVRYVPETGVLWTAVVTEVVDETNLMIRLTAFPPGEMPRGIERVISHDASEAQDTWHWPGESIQPLNDPFDNEADEETLKDLES